jgi:hypothetical protein
MGKKKENYETETSDIGLETQETDKKFGLYLCASQWTIGLAATGLVREHNRQTQCFFPQLNEG